MESNFIIGGKLGDFIHSMFAVKSICERDNTSANIYMYDDEWERDIAMTYAELKPIILNQKYIKSIHILENNDINNCPEPYINFSIFRSSEWIYRMCWTEFMSNTYGFSIPTTYSWLTHDYVNDEFKDKVLLFRKNHFGRINDVFPYSQIIEEYGEDLLFVSLTEDDYNAFPYRDMIPFRKIHTLHELFTAINSCKLIVGNLSAPMAIAHALDKLRVIELPHTVDANHCVGEEKYSKNVFWFLSPQIHNMR
jgi:hypothetical protein